MGKLAEKMKKAKTKAKAKVAAKTGKCGGNAKECAKAAVVLVAFAALAILCGCATTGEQPARSQTQTNRFDDCIVIVGAARTTVSNGVVVAEADVSPTAVELFTQTQANEGSETISPVATPTLDIKPDINVRYNDALKNATDASKGVLETLSEASSKAVLGLMSSKQSGVLDVEKSDGTAAKVKCEDGQCSFCTDC